jgi:hypothetical protein
MLVDVTARGREGRHRTAAAWITASAGMVVMLVAVVTLPWARYSAIDMMLIRFPGWGRYVVLTE